MNEQQTATAPAAPDAIPVPDAAPATASNPAPAPATAAAPAVETDYRALYESLKRENEILRHNAQIAQSSPVQGVTGGGPVSAPVDDFIRGFDSDTW